MGDTYKLHDIPLADALIGIYAAYYIGARAGARRDHTSLEFNARARNTYNMDSAIQAAFGEKDSPWIVLDHRSDKRRDPGNDAPMYGGHFIALYHKQSRRVMVALPGMEYDDGPKDTIEDLMEMTIGGMRGQTRALYDYIRDIESRLHAGTYRDKHGKPFETQGTPVIGSHSMGCTAAQVMALDGYNVILVEPRPTHAGLLNRLGRNYAHVTGRRIDRKTMLGRLDAHTVNLRARHSNIWNSVLLPWARQWKTGRNLVYGDEKPAALLDRFITTFHGVEVAVPSLMNDFNTKGAKGYREGATISLTNTPAVPLFLDIFAKKDRKPRKTAARKA